jgi:hypothetical protein
MATGQLDSVIRHLRRASAEGGLAGLNDGQLLGRFLERRDESAFATLMARHGPMVLGVCRRVLRHSVARLLAKLDDDDFATREAAAEELAKLGEQAGPILRALLKKPSPEVRRRLRDIRAVRHPEVSRQVRAVWVLERIGTPEARQLLKVLSGGAPAARLTKEARATLDRLARLRTG